MSKPLIACLFVTAACSGMDLGGPGGTGGDDDDSPPPPAISSTGTYIVESDLSVPADALLPEPAYQLDRTLHLIRENPGAGLIQLLDQAGVPLLADLHDALPSVLETQVDGWLSDEINAHADLSILDGVLALCDTTIGRATLVSELAVAGDTASHKPIGLVFGDEVEVSLEGLPLERSLHVEQDGSTLVLGDHAFGVPVGSYAWEALERAAIARTGTDLRGLLGRVVDCHAVAVSVAGKGALGYHVGHQSDLEALCNEGLDLVIDELHDAVSEYDWQALHLAHGTATLVDDDADGQADRLDGGVWSATIDAGLGAREIGATFAASR